MADSEIVGEGEYYEDQEIPAINIQTEDNEIISPEEHAKEESYYIDKYHLDRWE